MTVVALSPGGEAEKAGLQVGDIVTEIQGKTAGEESDQQLSRMQPGDHISVKVRSRGRDHELHWKIASRQQFSYQISDLDNVTPEQRAHRTAWLKGEAESAGAP
jgi:predicted metalloprotease with PDZ domain